MKRILLEQIIAEKNRGKKKMPLEEGRYEMQGGTQA